MSNQEKSIIEKIIVPNPFIDNPAFEAEEQLLMQEETLTQPEKESSHEPKQKREKKKLERIEFEKIEVSDARVHVMQRRADKLWEVKNSTSSRAARTFKTKEEALEYADSFAKTLNAKVIIH